MNIKETLFVLYDLGISLASLSKLYRETSQERLNRLLIGDYLELQFSTGIFNNNELNLLSSLDLIQKSIATVSDTLKFFSEEGIEYFIYYEEEYPRSLKNIPSPPFFIFMKGNKALLNNFCNLSIVGTRNPSEQTLKQIENVVPEMISSGITITSGLALGTDIHVHKCTLSNNGMTIAVLPSPIDNITPKIHQQYADQIVKKDGLLVSEYYKDEAVFKKTNYINRNRIISGLSNAVIIAECSEKSGTMHTARFAYKQKKELYCFDNESTGVQKILASNSAKIYKNLNDLNF